MAFDLISIFNWTLCLNGTEYFSSIFFLNWRMLFPQDAHQVHFPKYYQINNLPKHFSVICDVLFPEPHECSW